MLWILVIEDDFEVVSYLVKGFIELGYIVDKVVDGQIGLEMVLDSSYDILIVDWMLFCLDGLIVIEELWCE